MKEQYIHIDDHGNKFYYSDKEMTVRLRHREDGPAIEWVDGSKAWFINGERHREDGPAVEDADGYKAWYIDGKKLTEDELKNHLTLLPKNRRSRVERVLRYALCSDSRR